MRQLAYAWRDFMSQLSRQFSPEPKRPTFTTVDYTKRWAEQRQWMHTRGIRDIKPLIKGE